jgi:hypothetical protein
VEKAHPLEKVEDEGELGEGREDGVFGFWEGEGKASERIAVLCQKGVQGRHTFANELVVKDRKRPSEQGQQCGHDCSTDDKWSAVAFLEGFGELI